MKNFYIAIIVTILIMVIVPFNLSGYELLFGVSMVFLLTICIPVFRGLSARDKHLTSINRDKLGDRIGDNAYWKERDSENIWLFERVSVTKVIARRATSNTTPRTNSITIDEFIKMCDSGELIRVDKPEWRDKKK